MALSAEGMDGMTIDQQLAELRAMRARIQATDAELWGQHALGVNLHWAAQQIMPYAKPGGDVPAMNEKAARYLAQALPDMPAEEAGAFIRRYYKQHYEYCTAVRMLLMRRVTYQRLGRQHGGGCSAVMVDGKQFGALRYASDARNTSYQIPVDAANRAAFNLLDADCALNEILTERSGVGARGR